MKNFLTILFLISNLSVKSQIVLEHTYPYSNIKRVFLPNVGERYYADVYDYILKKGKVHWFNANHQAVTTHNYGPPPTTSGTPFVGIGRVTSDFFDTDPGIEYEKSWVSGSQGGGYGPGYSFHDDNGGVISASNTSYSNFLVTSGGNKIESGGKVYGVPGFIHEYTAPVSGLGYVTLEGPGGKFWYSNDDHLVLLNQDYSVYQDFEMALNSCLPRSVGLLLQGQYEINDDSKLEIFNYGSCNGTFQAQYFSDADLIFHFQESVGTQSVTARSLLPSEYPGLEGAKLWIRYGNTSDSIVIYDVLSGAKEHKFVNRWTYMNSDLSGVKYLRTEVSKSDTTFQVLNPDYTVWAEFRKDTSAALTPFLLSESLFDGDPSTREILSASVLDSIYRWRITRTDGTVLFEMDLSAEVRLDQTPGLERKLIFNTPAIANLEGKTYVYSLPDPLPPVYPPTEHDDAFGLQSNPFTDVLRLDFSRLAAPVDGVQVFNMQGHLMYESRAVISDPAWEIPVAGDWSRGLYMVRVFSGGKRLVQKAIRH